ncbi:MAG: DnaB-like helicase N-terminal domain-containing protein, partial [Acholeplasmatales bacterium]
MKDTKTMPHNIEAEKSVLGAIFLSPETLATIADELSVEDFYEERNRSVFYALTRLLEKNEKIDLTTVSTELAQINMMSKVGGNYLAELIDFTPTLANLESYIEIVKDYSLKRAMIELSGDIH